jgi:hypothetical protein
MTEGDTMFKLKAFAAAAVAAVAIAVGGLVATPSASAMPRYSCATALQLARSYIATGDILYANGAYSAAAYYYGRATGIVEASC